MIEASVSGNIPIQASSQIERFARFTFVRFRAEFMCDRNVVDVLDGDDLLFDQQLYECDVRQEQCVFDKGHLNFLSVGCGTLTVAEAGGATSPSGGGASA